MSNLIHKSSTKIGASFIAAFFLILITFLATSVITTAYDGKGPKVGRLITIHDQGVEKVILSEASTIGDAIKEAGISINSNDAVEPSVDEKLVASDYQVNIYRARSVIIVDGSNRQKINTPYQTAEQIIESVGITLYPEDKTTFSHIDNLTDGFGVQITIDRAIPFIFTLYGKTSTIRTQAKTVSGMLSEKGIKLGINDHISINSNTKITDGLNVKVWREGKQTITVEEEVGFDIEKIQNADMDVGYREVKVSGEKGTRNVTYEVVIQDGQEVSRKEIASLTIKESKKQVEIVGAKLSFNGDFAAALAKLRSCEGGYNSWNPAGPYYGAYQFDRRTWGTVADPAKYGSATPAEQDEAAYRLYLRRGWQPWPVCGAAVLPDVYR